MSVLAKKIGLGGVGRSPIPDIERLGEFIARELEHAFRPILSSQVAAMVMDSEVARLSEVLEQIPAPSCVGVLSFPGVQNKALVNFDADLIFHVVDLRMGGDASVCPLPTTRSLTAIDMALCEEPMTETIWAFERAIETQLGGSLGSHFAVKERAQNVSNVAIAGESADVLRFSVGLDIGVAARSGNVDIVAPLSVLDIVRSSVETDRTDVGVAVRDIWRERMLRAVHEAELPLDVVIARPRLPTDTIKKLAVGDVIPVPSNAPHKVRLQMDAKTRNSYTVAEARLGGFEGRKVVKLNDTPDPQVVRNILTSTQDDT